MNRLKQHTKNYCQCEKLVGYCHQCRKYGKLTANDKMHIAIIAFTLLLMLFIAAGCGVGTKPASVNAQSNHGGARYSSPIHQHK